MSMWFYFGVKINYQILDLSFPLPPSPSPFLLFPFPTSLSQSPLPRLSEFPPVLFSEFPPSWIVSNTISTASAACRYFKGLKFHSDFEILAEHSHPYMNHHFKLTINLMTILLFLLGVQPLSFRQAKYLVQRTYPSMAWMMPEFVYVPSWLVAAATHKLWSRDWLTSVTE